MADTITDLRAQIDAVRFNPSAIHQIALNYLEQLTGGNIDVVDPNHPFVFAMEMSAVTTSSAMVQSEALVRKLYPSMALTEEELYLHMSDRDYADRFSQPSSTDFVLLLGRDEVYNRAVDTGINGIRKLTIPRHTEFRIAGYTFTMQYPIDIRIMGHGGMQVVYDVTKPSPLKTIESNIVQWGVTKINAVDFIKLVIPVEQFTLTPQYTSLNSATGFVKTYQLEHPYYYCRAYMANDDGTWEEILTTHSDQVFDPLTPTLLLRVYENSLRVALPHVYQNTHLVNRELRIDIFTTQGPLDLLLDNYEVGAFEAQWRDLENDDQGIYTAPLSAFNTLAIYSSSSVSGGRNPLDFDTLRERVINNAMGTANLPITNVQIGAALSNQGYELVQVIDNVTSRVFLATRSLPAPSNALTITGASARISVVSVTMEELSEIDTVQVNGDRQTILPTTLYELRGGLVKPLSAGERLALTALSAEDLVERTSERQYLYTPFHYVLDSADDTFDLRAYYLDNPQVESREFLEENSTSGITVTTSGVVVSRVSNGYQLRITTRSGDNFKALDDADIYVQLAFYPEYEDAYAFMNGTLVGKLDSGERVYEFNILTDHDVDDEDNLILTSFSMFKTEERRFASKLLGEFDIFYVSGTERPLGYLETDIDVLVGQDLLPDAYMGLTHERLSLRMGWSLDDLWCNSRTVVSSINYQRYTTDVQAFWERNVYEMDEETQTAALVDDGAGGYALKLLHAKGDPVLDDQGNITYSHRAGDVMTDPEGNPLVQNERGLLRHLELCMLDGLYYFVTEDQAVSYRTEIAKTLVSWITENISEMSLKLLEQTELFFYPRTGLGEVTAMVEEGKQITMSSAQRMQVVFYLSRANYGNGNLRQALESMAIEVIATQLNNTTVTIKDMIREIDTRAGDDIIAVELKGLGGDSNYPALTIMDDSTRCTLGKRLVIQPDNTLSVEDDVEVRFLRHERS